MRKTIILSVLILLGMTVSAQSKKFTAKGTIDLETGNLFLVTQRDGKADTLAKSPIVNSEFSMEGSIDTPIMATFAVEGFLGGVMFFMEPGNITADLRKSTRSDINNGTINADFVEYTKIVAEYNNASRVLQQEVDSLSKERKFKSAALVKEKEEPLKIETEKRLEAIINRNKENVLGAYLTISNVRSENPIVLRELYDGLTPMAKKTELAKDLLKKIQQIESLDIGKSAPNFSLPTNQGGMISLQELKGKVKIIDFWASWCGPCRLENPNMVKLYAAYKEKGLEILSISLDDNKEKWLEAIAKDNLTWKHVSSLKGWKCEVAQKYNVTGVPHILILDEENKIIAMQLRGEALEKFIASLLDRQ